MLRPEDGAWDPRGNGDDALYFVTTASISPLRNSRLITQDEESSGIIDAQHIFGAGWFLFVVQNHKPVDPLVDAELVQGGQLLAMYVHPRIARS